MRNAISPLGRRVRPLHPHLAGALVDPRPNAVHVVRRPSPDHFTDERCSSRLQLYSGASANTLANLGSYVGQR